MTLQKQYSPGSSSENHAFVERFRQLISVSIEQREMQNQGI
ncbi:hypothetical protein ACIPUO_05395 [Pectobacterium carotovorum]